MVIQIDTMVLKGVNILTVFLCCHVGMYMQIPDGTYTSGEKKGGDV